jgi:hypothetical protein
MIYVCHKSHRCRIRYASEIKATPIMVGVGLRARFESYSRTKKRYTLQVASDRTATLLVCASEFKTCWSPYVPAPHTETSARQPSRSGRGKHKENGDV